MRSAKETDFFVELPEVGVFRFGRRTFGDRMKIRAEYLRLVKEHGDLDDELSMYAAIIAAHTVLCVESPPGWENLSDLDMLCLNDPEQRIYDLYSLLKDKEDALRQGESKSGQAAGQATT